MPYDKDVGINGVSGGGRRGISRGRDFCNILINTGEVVAIPKQEVGR